MKYRYGGHTFNEGEVQLDSVDRELIRSESNRPMLVRVTHNCTGQLLVASSATTPIDRQNDLKLKMQQVEAAFVDGQDCGLLDANDAPSHHYFVDAQTFSGVRIKQPLQWGSLSNGAEYAAFVSFSFAIEATFIDPNISSFTYSLKESITITGTGGPRVVAVEVDNGVPILQQVATNTVVRATQSGTIVGLHLYVPPPSPFWPSKEQVANRKIQKQSAVRHGDSGMVGLWKYPTTYSYEFLSTTSLGSVNPSQP